MVTTNIVDPKVPYYFDSLLDDLNFVEKWAKPLVHSAEVYVIGDALTRTVFSLCEGIKPERYGFGGESAVLVSSRRGFSRLVCDASHRWREGADKMSYGRIEGKKFLTDDPDYLLPALDLFVTENAIAQLMQDIDVASRQTYLSAQGLYVSLAAFESIRKKEIRLLNLYNPASAFHSVLRDLSYGWKLGKGVVGRLKASLGADIETFVKNVDVSLFGLIDRKGFEFFFPRDEIEAFCERKELISRQAKTTTA